jgi:hypothetical protein
LAVEAVGSQLPRSPAVALLAHSRSPSLAQGWLAQADAIRPAGLAAGALAELLTDHAADSISGVALVVRAR